MKLTIFLCFLAGLVLTHGQEACVQQTMENKKFVDCTKVMTDAFTQNTASLTSLEGIMALMCRPEVKDSVKCIMEFIADCPAMSESSATGLGGMFNMSMVESSGGIDSFCEMMSEECRPLRTCLGLSDGPVPEPESEPPMSAPNMPPGSGSQMTLFPQLIAQVPNVCNQAGKKMICLNDYKSTCPNMVEKQFVPQMKSMLNQEGNPMTFEKVQTFSVRHCKNLEEFESKTACLTEKVQQDTFVTCYNAVLEEYTANNMKLTCDMYMKGKKCLQTAAQLDCGATSTNMLAAASPLAITGAPADCEPVSSASFLGASLMALFLAALLAVGLVP